MNKKISDKDKDDWENFLENKQKTSSKIDDKKTIEILDKDKQDWENFLKNKEKIHNKDFVNKKKIRHEKIKKIDLHGYTIEEANKIVEKFFQKCFDESVTKIIVITGKGLRSKNVENPYLSKDLSILKYSVPEFIESNESITSKIIEIKDAKIEDGGSGAFYVYLKNKKKMSSEKKQSIFNLFPLALFRDKIEIAESEREILVNEILFQEKNSKNKIDKGKQPAWTGDTQGHEFLFKNKNLKNYFL